MDEENIHNQFSTAHKAAKLAYTNGDYTAVSEIAGKIDLARVYRSGRFELCEICFYAGLAVAAEPLGEPGLDGRRRKQSEMISTYIQYVETLMETAKLENYKQKLLLLKAELARTEGRKLEAMGFYETSLAEAQKSAAPEDEALSGVLAGTFFRGLRMEKAAGFYLKNARRQYESLGVKDRDVPAGGDSLQYHREYLPAAGSGEGSDSSSRGSTYLNLKTVIKASQAISGEVELKKLLERLMLIVIENAGAQKGVLALLKKNVFRIEASKSVDDQSVRVLESIALEQSREVAFSVIYYVEKSLKSLVIGDAEREELFHGDSYIQRVKPKSIMCIPLLLHEKLTGILYLENNLSTNSFSGDQLEVLNLLSTQIASAIENAYLYESQKEIARLTHLDGLRTKFYTNTSHELRTPLTLILSPLRTLLEMELEEGESRLIGIAERSAQNLLLMINELLGRARQESGVKPPTSNESRPGIASPEGKSVHGAPSPVDLQLSPSEGRILIVEDVPDMLNYIASIFEQGYQVFKAENGRIGYEEALSVQPDLIISDIMMPVMDGYELLLKIRGTQKLKGLPVVLLSARGEVDEKIKGLTRGADEYIAKPFNPQELFLRVKNLLYKKKQRELSVARERQEIYADFHDNLGAELTDLLLLIRKVERDGAQAPGLLQQIKDKVADTMKQYQYLVSGSEGLELMELDFTEGLLSLLERRYENLTRDWNFSVDEQSRQALEHTSEFMKRNLFRVIKEVSTNDLKYGRDISHWSIYTSGGQNKILHIQLLAGTTYRKPTGASGMGQDNIRRKLSEIKGAVIESFTDESIRVELEVPI